MPPGRVSQGNTLTDLDSGMSDADMDLDGAVDERPSAFKRKTYEVEFDSLPQSAVETLIRKDVDHISSIFGVSVSWKQPALLGVVC